MHIRSAIIVRKNLKLFAGNVSNYLIHLPVKMWPREYLILFLSLLRLKFISTKFNIVYTVQMATSKLIIILSVWLKHSNENGSHSPWKPNRKKRIQFVLNVNRIWHPKNVFNANKIIVNNVRRNPILLE